MGSRVSAAVVLTMLLGATAACAHEFWVEPGSFTPAVGDRVPVHLFVGASSDRDEIPRRSDHLLRFESVGLDGTSSIGGPFGRTPAGFLHPDAPGALLVVYQGRPTFIELPASRFESYLEEEGLSRVIAERLRRNESLRPGRESYARHAKSLVFAHGGQEVPARGFDAEIGLPIEFVPEDDPRAWQPGDPFGVRLLYEGHPLADQQIKLIHLVDRDLQLISRTDGEGRARLSPPQAGPWMVASVFMRRAPEGTQAEWESLWASFTFALPGRAGVQPIR